MHKIIHRFYSTLYTATSCNSDKNRGLCKHRKITRGQKTSPWFDKEEEYQSALPIPKERHPLVEGWFPFDAGAGKTFCFSPSFYEKRGGAVAASFLFCRKIAGQCFLLPCRAGGPHPAGEIGGNRKVFVKRQQNQNRFALKRQTNATFRPRFRSRFRIPANAGRRQLQGG